MAAEMIARVFIYLMAGVIGIAAGVSSALYLSGLWSTKKPMEFGNINVGGWVSDFAVGSKQASPYVRARVARHGLLALANTEAVYFVRGADDAGERLVENCDYQLTGGALPAGWWSITLYQTSDSKLPMNDDDALSVDATSVVLDGEEGSEAWRIRISPERAFDEPNWISSREAERFDLLLRLYVPEAGLLTDPEGTLAPPSIERLGCTEDSA
ncbi:MAG: DUF1214 domain-containing protein [Pseudomonadota bacterium]